MTVWWMIAWVSAVKVKRLKKYKDVRYKDDVEWAPCVSPTVHVKQCYTVTPSPELTCQVITSRHERISPHQFSLDQLLIQDYSTQSAGLKHISLSTLNTAPETQLRGTTKSLIRRYNNQKTTKKSQCYFTLNKTTMQRSHGKKNRNVLETFKDRNHAQSN